MLTEYNNGDRTILERDQVYDDIVEEYDKTGNHYVYNHEIMYVIVNDWYNHKIRLLFDDMG